MVQVQVEMASSYSTGQVELVMEVYCVDQERSLHVYEHVRSPEIKSIGSYSSSTLAYCWFYSS
jgi:hypothetical protein